MKIHWNFAALGIGCALLCMDAAQAQTALTWADFGTNVRTKQEIPLRAIVMSERAGDAGLESMEVKDGSAQIVGRLSTKNGSGWSTLGIEFGRSPNTTTSSMSAYQNMRIRLSSPQPRVLRIRLKGSDLKVQKAGCYPVMMQQVGTVPTDYIIPLNSFEAERYCGADGATPDTTLPDLVAVEVTANEPSETPIRFNVGRIDFLRTATAPAPAPAAVHAERGPEWKLAWSDEFDGPANKSFESARWSVQRTLQRATDANSPSTKELSLDGQGHLSMQLPAADSVGSLRLLAKPAAVMLYGRLEVRFKPPASRAVNTRIALQGAPLTDLPWPEAGEIVMAEFDSAQRQMSVGLVGPDLIDDEEMTDAPVDDNFASKFHTAALEWEPGHIKWLLDDVLVKDLHRDQLPAAAQSTFDQWPYLLQFGVESASNSNAAAKTSGGLALQIDSVQMFKRTDLTSAAAERLAIWQGQNVTQRVIPSERPTQQPKQQTKAAAAPPPAQPTRVVVCSRDNKYGLLMCH